ncbi:ATP-binding protein [Undibacterium sp. Ren11W]|uniref:ATP-binding protein n=1 Tax=Undibacterium sp. Ren11W TaxID=3413045 RepID=UPI003BF03290
MKRFFSDTIFSRMFGLAMAAVIASHIITLVLLFAFLGDHLPPHSTSFAPHSTQSLAQAGPAPDFPAPPTPPPMPPPHLRAHPPHNQSLMSGPFLGFFVSMLLQLGFLALATFWGSRSLAKPIQRLADAASLIGDKLNAPALLESGPSEVRQAARIFNSMQQKIHTQLEERGRFLASVSHDLRTPLTRMYLRVEHLENEREKDKLRQDIEEMRQMLDATLDYLRDSAHGSTLDSDSKIANTAGQFGKLGQSLDIEALLEVLTDDAREQGKEVSLTGNTLPIIAIPADLRRCLSNLLENAVNYGKSAHISLHDSASQLVIRISDKGPGIPEDALLQVFEPFYRLSSSRNKNTGGVGLGLAIAREIVRQHAGQLELYNNVPGPGLTAQLTLPRTSSHSALDGK